MNYFLKNLIKLYCGLIHNEEKRRAIREFLLGNKELTTPNVQKNQEVELKAFNYLDFTYIDKWKNYYSQHYSTINEKLDILKHGMDPKSQEIADLIFERNMLISYFEKYRDIVKFDDSKIFRNWEYEDYKKQQLQIEEYFSIIVDLDKYPKLYQEKHLFVTDNGLKDLPDKILEYIKNKDFIDGGAWVGDSAVILGKYLPNKIYSFEPMKDNYDELIRIINAKDDLKRIVTPICAGLGEKQKTEVCCQRTSGSTFLTDCFDNLPTEEIDIVDIDSFSIEHKLNIGLIKLDVEGYELPTIIGALNSIAKDRPVLLISVYHLPEDFFEIKPLIEKEIGDYEFKMVKLMQLSPTIDTILIGYPKEVLND